jgi:tetratricopeptide (TPR) repeat protein
VEARASRILVAAAACLLLLSGCESSTRLGDSNPEASQGVASEPEPAVTGSVRKTPAEKKPETVAKGPPGKSENELALGKKQFGAGKFAMAERHFRRALELNPRDLEAWLRLAACYDNLRRFKLADRAYDEAVKIAGPTAEILNNRGYSYLLRGDYPRARETLSEAQGKDPANAYIKNNIELLEASVQKNKAIQ